MSRRARVYISAVLLASALLGGLALTMPTPADTAVDWPAFITLTVLATVAQLYKAEAPNHQTYFASPVFFFAGLFLLRPSLAVPLVVIPHLVEWAKERWVRSPLLRRWYLQPFNIAKCVVASGGAYALRIALPGGQAGFAAAESVVAVALAAALYVALNQLLLGGALVLARGVSWRESGVLDGENVLTELVLVLLGSAVAALWRVNPALILPALSPLVLMYRALQIPQLKQQAHTDGKTGLHNTRHFDGLFTSELDRARRFNRPLALIIADLDRFKAINDTHGHLVGDAVLAEVGRVIRATARDYDIAARFGGEEFALALPETGPAAAALFAERLRAAVEGARVELAPGALPVRVTMSIGVACFPADAHTVEGLTHAADVAVYRAKAAGRNGVVCADGFAHPCYPGPMSLPAPAGPADGPALSRPAS